MQEIRGYDAVTTIANAPEFIKGVINLRGIIAPIVDLRIKFQVGAAPGRRRPFVDVVRGQQRAGLLDEVGGLGDDIVGSVGGPGVVLHIADRGDESAVVRTALGGRLDRVEPAAGMNAAHHVTVAAVPKCDFAALG